MTNPSAESNNGQSIRPNLPSIIKVLVVDEQPLSQRLLSKHLQEIDPNRYQLTFLEDYQDALTCLAQNEFDVALIDFHFERHKNGFELIRSAIAKGCSKPLLLLIPNKKSSLGQEALLAGATYCL